MNAHMYVCIWAKTCHGSFVEIRAQFFGVGSFLLPGRIKLKSPALVEIAFAY